MKTTAALALGLLGSVWLTAAAQEKGEAPKLDGKYTLVSGKINGKAVGDDAKKGEYTFTGDKITIRAMDLKFVMGYKLDAKTSPTNIDMEILEGPEGTKGTKAAGVVELKGDTLKLAYMIDKDKRAKDFDGKDGFYFELKKAGKKKD
ncbi:MAG: hypothetical protein C0501_29975 [Isosphaera sp.]|nr:hypothetical protein [Isosphaera sp.]